MESGSSHGNEYGVPSKTVKGEIVKSRGEKQIADYLYSHGIKHVYEDQAKTTGSAITNRISKPDFYLPDLGVYVEYWGLFDVDDSEQRKKYRRDMHWKMDQYFKNGIKFIPLYPWHLDDIDGAFTAQYKKVMKKDWLTGPINDASVFALPISFNYQQVIGAAVPEGLGLKEFQLEYRPYYFVEYDCFTQGNFYYQRVNLASHGTLVIDGQGGQVVDLAVKSGVWPNIQRSRFLVGCEKIEPKETPRSKVAFGDTFSRFEAFPVKATKYDAERTAQVEIAKNLSQTYSRQLRNGSVSTTTIRPYANEVRIVSTKLKHVPIVTGVFAFKDRNYRRIIQSSTNRVLADDLVYCNIGQIHFGQGLFLCRECGGLACKEHGRPCAICGRFRCLNHAIPKGLILKKYYCREHVPA